MDTRMRVSLLLDYTEYYGEKKTIADAIQLISEIPSESLINYISGININLYLRENDEDSHKRQIWLAKNILRIIGAEAEKKYIAVHQKQVDAGHSPIIFWNYTNLQFYDLIFSNFNTLPCRELTGNELQKFFEAYLILNSIANDRVAIDQTEIDQALSSNSFENIVMANFIYQKDYASTVDYANQVTRGVMFFRYLENDPKFGPAVHDFYAEKKVSGYLSMFRNLMVLFTKIGVELEHRIQIADLTDYTREGIVNSDYVNTLCINEMIPTYKQDQSFTTLRNHFLYKTGMNKYYILDVNFLIDYFYKAQVFAFNAFLRKRKITSEFLSIKGQNFSDKIYFPEVIRNTFPSYTTFFGSDCINSSNEELCDAYIRHENKMILIEFKDVLLNANIKNGADEVALFKEFNTKFVENQTGKPKGLTQLKIAVTDINENSVKFDPHLPKGELIIYPIIVYTDLSFGAEGLNKMYRAKFKNQINDLELQNIEVRDLTFINLNFFEHRQDYFAAGITNIFDFLDKYHEHILDEKYELTTFEVFSRYYTNANFPEELGQPKSYLEFQKEIVLSPPGK